MLNFSTVSPEGSVTVSPLNAVHSFEDNVTLTCDAMGGPNNSFVWEVNGTILANEKNLNLVAINASHGGIYTCTVSNAAGNSSTSTGLYVAPYIVNGVEEQVLAGVSYFVRIRCNAAGFPAPTVKWINELGLEVSSTSVLQFSIVRFGEEGNYRCVATIEINELNFTATDETTLTCKS